MYSSVNKVQFVRSGALELCKARLPPAGTTLTQLADTQRLVSVSHRHDLQTQGMAFAEDNAPHVHR